VIRIKNQKGTAREERIGATAGEKPLGQKVLYYKKGKSKM